MRIFRYRRVRRGAAWATAIAIWSCSGTTEQITTNTVAAVVVTPSALTLLVGEQQPVQAAIQGTDGRPVSGAVAVWSIKDGKIANVSLTGVVTALAVGVTEVAASSNGKSGIAAITVQRPPIASVVVLPRHVDALAGSRTPLMALAYDGSGNVLSGRAFIWASSNSLIASVDTAGILTAVGPGSATITATAEGKSDAATITVTQTPVASVTVTPALLSMSLGQTSQLAATARDAAGNALVGRSFQWSTSNAGIAAVSADGTVTARGAGNATITATTDDNKSGTATVTIGPPVASVSIQPPTVTINQNVSQQLTATVRDVTDAIVVRPVTWTTSDARIATVTPTGLVAGLSAGDVTITATSEGKSGTARVTILRAPVVTVTVQPSSANALVRTTTTFTATVKDVFNIPLSGRVVTWSSSNNAIATVSSNGDVTGVAAGTATIIATCEGVIGTATVTVTLVPVGSVSVLPATASVLAGQTATLAATVRDVNGTVVTDRAVAWTSSAPGVAAVSATGVVTGVTAGNATITATSEGKSGTSVITVFLEPVATVTVLPSTATVIVGSTIQLTAATKDANGNVLTGRVVEWSLGDESIANLRPNGLVVAAGVGTSTITATSEGKSGTAIITVIPVPVATITVQPSTATVAVGSTTTLTAFTRDASGNVLTGRVVTWSTSAGAIATVSAAGVVTGVARGSAVITATSEGKTGTATVTVP